LQQNECAGLADVPDDEVYLAKMGWVENFNGN
jgi:hypothetical protein